MEKLKANPYTQRFWYEWKSQPESDRYNTPLIDRIEGELDIATLEKAIYALVNEYVDSLRSTYIEEDGVVYQCIWRVLQVKLQHKTFKTKLSEKKLKQEVEKVCQQPFDIEKGPVYRYTLFHLPNSQYVLISNHHHIATDAVTGAIIHKTISQLYQHFAHGAPKPTIEEGMTKEAQALLRQASVATTDEASEYWSRKYKKPLTEAEIINPVLKNEPDGSLYVTLGSPLVDALQSFCANKNKSPFEVLLASYFLVLRKYLNQDSFSVSYPVNARPPSLKKLPGCFINLIPMQLSIESNFTLSELLELISSTRKEERQIQQTETSELFKRLKLTPQRLSLSMMQTYLGVGSLDLGESLTTQSHLVSHQDSFCDLNLAFDLQEKLFLRLDYKSHTLTRKRAKLFLVRFKKALKLILEQSDKCVHDIDLRTVFEKKKQSLAFQVEVEDDGLLSAIMANGSKTPEATAVSLEQDTLTYRALVANTLCLSRAIANGFRGKRQQAVAVIMSRSPELVTTLLAVLQSGNYYIPIDAKTPLPQIKQLLAEIDLSLVVVDKTLYQRLKRAKLAQANLVTYDMLVNEPQDVSCAVKPVTEQEKAYVIFTSGSTGVPKGVAVSAENLTNVVAHFSREFKAVTRKVISTTSIGFDIFVLEMFLPLISAGEMVVLTDKEKLDPEVFYKRIKSVKATLLQATPSLLSILCQGSARLTRVVECVFSGGEPLSKSLGDKLLKLSDDVYNVYGPTETTVWSTYSKVLPNREITLGKPIQNTSVRVLDNDGKEALPFVAGELLIGGKGVALGYYQDSKKTHEKFIHYQNEQFYKTGDLVYFNEQYELIFVGRVDNQVKINGQRLDLSGMEAKLLALKRVSEVYAHLDEKRNKELVLYLKEKKRTLLEKLVKRLFDKFNIESRWISKTPTKETVIEVLEPFYPQSLLPKAVVSVKAFPLTQSGKINNKALPRPQRQHYFKQTPVVHASDLIEFQIMAVWKSVLGIEQVGKFDKFFDIGGDSLLAVTLVTRLNQFFSQQYPVSWIISCPTISQQAMVIREQQKIGATYKPIITYQTGENYVPLFLIHPGLAGSEVYAELALHLDDRIPFYALDSYNLNSGQKMVKTIPELAQKYIEFINTVYPKGPLTLGGWSMGGSLAYEIAQQLRLSKREVVCLYMLDGNTFNKKHLRGLDKLVSIEGLEHELPECRGKQLTELPEEYVERVVTSLKNDIRMLLKYKLRPYDGRMLLLKSTDMIRLNQDIIKHEYNGWDTYVKNISCQLVKAHHYGLLEDENAKKVADVLSKDLLAQQSLDVRNLG